MKEIIRHASDLKCCYPFCKKKAHAFAYWLPNGNPDKPLCEEHFALAQFIGWYLNEKEAKL